MKKVGLALCPCSTVFMAQAANAQWQGNFLLGASGGWAWHNSDDDVLNVTINHQPGISAYQFGNLGDRDDSNFFGGLLAGYQAKCNGWLLGGEVSVDWLDRGDNNGVSATVVDPIDGAISFTASDDNHNDAIVGLTARLGYEVSPWFMPYIRLGAEYGGHRNGFNYTATAPAAADPAPYAVVSDDDNDHRWGFIGGLGAEIPVPVFSGISFRGEWNYHSRGHHNDDNRVTVASDNKHIFTVTNGDDHRHINTLKFSLVWNIPA
jgi:opacity protein-like surface antigen